MRKNVALMMTGVILFLSACSLAEIETNTDSLQETVLETNDTTTGDAVEKSSNSSEKKDEGAIKKEKRTKMESG